MLSHLPKNVHLISRVHPKAALYGPAPTPAPGTKPKGRPRKKGARLPGMAAWAAEPQQPWMTLEFQPLRPPCHARRFKNDASCSYYTSGGARLLTIALVRDLQGKRPDQMFYCTKLDWDARQILATYAFRWAIECTFENCKQLLGLGEQANRLPKAVELERAPMAFFLDTIVVVWFHRVGHESVRFPTRPWYRHKQEPSFADMLTTLRRMSYDEKTASLLPKCCEWKSWIAQLTEFVSRAG